MHKAEPQTGQYIVGYGVFSPSTHVRDSMNSIVNCTDSELRMRALIQAIPDLVWLKDTEGVYLSCNARFEQFFGVLEGAIVGKTDYDFVAKELVDFFRKNDQVAMAKGGPSRNEEWVTFASDGHRELLETTKTPVRDAKGNVIGVLGIGHDITERNRNELALVESEDRFRTVFEISLDAIVLHRNGKLLFVNPAAVQMFGAKSAQELLDKPIRDLIHPDSYKLVLERVKAATEHGIAGPRLEEKYIKLDGTVFDVEAQGQPIFLSGQPAVLATLRDITERKAMEAKMHQMAFFDALTGLPNRRMLGDRLSQTIAVSKRSGLYCALMFLDMDNFKPLNDTYGHEVGDLLLIEVARRLTECLREVDTVARFGGDEFVVMLSELGAGKTLSTEQAAGVAEKIRASMAAPYLLTVARQENHVTTVEHHCTTSIGVVVFVNHEASQADIMNWADAAMYQAKDAGRNAVRFYNLPH
jgi:diguanylate cyclase (GGDEF)-like protein/PAS domain S-box-containing protein